jgi:hypothetical protein
MTTPDTRTRVHMYCQRCSQAHRLQSTAVDSSDTLPTVTDYKRPLARNSKTEGRGFESFRPCHVFGRCLYSQSVVFGRLIIGSPPHSWSLGVANGRPTRLADDGFARCAELDC